MMRFVLGSLLCAGALSAGTINSSTVNFILDTGGGPAPTNIFDSSVTQFDPTLGTLTGVTVFMNATVIMDLQAQIEGQGQTSIFGNFSEGAFLNDLPGVPEFDTYLEVEQLHFGCNGTGNDELTGCSVTQSFNSGLNVDSGEPLAPTPNLNAYIGSGNVPFEVGNYTSISGVTSMPALTDTNSNLFFNSTEIDGSFFLQYTYTAATLATPEPGTTSLLGAGLVLFGLMRYRKAFQIRTAAPQRNPRSA